MVQQTENVFAECKQQTATMSAQLRFFLAFVAAVAVLEAAWLSSAPAKRMYARNIAAVQGGKALEVKWPWAALCYVVLLAAAWVLVVRPVAEGLPGAPLRSRLAAGAWRASALALGAYGVYNLTNLATLRSWSPKVAAVDMTWGLVMLNAATAVAVLATQK